MLKTLQDILEMSHALQSVDLNLLSILWKSNVFNALVYIGLLDLCRYVANRSCDGNGQVRYMMTSSNGNIFRVTGPLCGEFTGPGEFPTQRPVPRSFDVFFDGVWINGWVNNREASDLRRHRGHYDVNVMYTHIRDQANTFRFKLHLNVVITMSHWRHKTWSTMEIQEIIIS